MLNNVLIFCKFFVVIVIMVFVCVIVVGVLFY